MSEATASTNDDDNDANDANDLSSSESHTGLDGSTTVTRDGHGGVKTVTIGPNGVHTSTAVTTDEAPSHWHRHGGFDSWMAIIALVIIAGIIKTAIRARHGDTRTNRQRRADRKAGVGFVPPATANRENEALAEENAKLRAQATRMEERIAVLERIVTDPGKRVSDEIEALR